MGMPSNDARNRFAGCAAQVPGASLPWLRQQRDAALARFAEVGLPTTRDEDWKYTNVAPLARREFVPSPAVPAELAERAALPFDFAGGAWLVFVNGRPVPALSRVRGLPAGVHADSVAARLDASPDAVAALLRDARGGDEHAPANGFTLLNDALWTDGAFIDIAAGTIVDAPIHLLFVTVANAPPAPHAGAAAAGAPPATPAGFVRNLIHVGRGARATVIEHYVGADGLVYLTDAVTRVVVDEDAVLTHATLQEEGRRAFHVATLVFAQARGSRIVSQSFALGAQLARTDIATRLGGEACAATLLGLYVGDARRHIDHHTRIDHAHPQGTSREYYKGVIDDDAHAVFNGRVIVHRDAQRTDAEQANHNLLLSDTAEVDTKPQLEIYADDVKCSHGATVGQIDAEQRYYLRTRGIDDASAQAVLIRAFADEIIAQAEPAALRARLEAWLDARLAVDDKETSCKALETS